MKTKDIIRGFELCLKSGNHCSECPFHQFGNFCKIRRSEEALPRMKQLLKENNRLSKKVETLKIRINSIYGKNRKEVKNDV